MSVINFETVLKEELQYIRDRRNDTHPTAQATPPPPESSNDLAKIQNEALQLDLCGLSISGGGIRSATFGLGVLQTLAAADWLKRFDYLSTVSGGGYIGGWLSAWIRRQGLANVVKGLPPSWYSSEESQRDVEPIELNHLRLYSNYIAPRVGILSTDGWTVIAIYLRNLLVNQLVLFTGLVALFFLLRALVAVFSLAHVTAFEPSTWNFADVLMWGTRISFGLCVLLNTVFAANRLEWKAWPLGTYHLAFWSSFFASVLTALLYTTPDAAEWLSKETLPVTAGKFLAIVIGAHICSCLALIMDGEKIFVKFVCALFAGIAAGVAATAVSLASLILLHRPESGTVALMATFGAPLLALAFVVGNFVQIGLLGEFIRPLDRERWSSYNARALRAIVVWTIIAAIVVYGPALVILITTCRPDPETKTWLSGQVWGWILGGGWAGTTLGGLWAGSSADTSGKSNGMKEMLAKLAPAVFLAGLGVLLAYFSTWLAYLDEQRITGDSFAVAQYHYLAHLDRVRASSDLTPYWEQYFPNWSHCIPALELCTPFLKLALTTIVLVVLSYAFSLGVGVNAFTLHDLYALRLVRCYLGAVRRRPREGNGIRVADPLTNFDKDDDFPVSELCGGLTRDNTPTPPGKYGPYHLLNAALNRRIAKSSQRSKKKCVQDAAATTRQAPTTQGETPRDKVEKSQAADKVSEYLAFQDRKAESFVFTPRYCGSDTTSYCPTKDFANNVSLGTAIAVSGAAASPNMGYSSSPAVTALMTMFNVRLGAWFGNPREKTRGSTNPPSWQYLMNEMLGNVSSEDKYVYISDGGHYENMGVFELLRRRCRFVVAIDTWADPQMSRENLGRLVRRARIDLGIRIEIDIEQTRIGGDLRYCKSHFAIGRIHYGDVHGPTPKGKDQDPPAFDDPSYHYEQNEGILVYLKVGLTGDEPNDLLNYRSENPLFPHHPISDQFFDEAQFESYRSLGIHTARVLLEGYRSRFPTDSGNPPGPGVPGGPPGGPPPAAAAAIKGELMMLNDPEGVSKQGTWTNREQFRSLFDRWLSPPPHVPDGYVHSNEEYSKLLSKLRTVPELRDLAADIYIAPLQRADVPGTPMHIAERLMVGEMCTMLEDFMFSVEFEKYYRHPLHAGWLNLFRNWSRSRIFMDHWSAIQSEFSPNLQRFLAVVVAEEAAKATLPERIEAKHKKAADEKIAADAKLAADAAVAAKLVEQAAADAAKREAEAPAAKQRDGQPQGNPNQQNKKKKRK